MKRLILLLFGMVLVLILAYIGTHQENEESVTILSFKEDMSVILYLYDELYLPVYASEENSYLMDETYISSTKIVSEDMDVLVDLTITPTEQTVMDGLDVYYEYQFGLSFPFIECSDTSIYFENTLLHIVYQNNDTLDLEFGSIGFVYQNEYREDDLTYYHLYGIQNSDSLLEGLLLKLETKDKDIVITNINLLHPDYQIDLANVWRINDGNYSSTYQMESQILSTIDLTEESYPLSEEVTLYLPFELGSSRFWMKRFAIDVTYKINGITKHYFIDDFIYYQFYIQNLEEYPYERVETVHHY